MAVGWSFQKKFFLVANGFECLCPVLGGGGLGVVMGVESPSGRKEVSLSPR